MSDDKMRAEFEAWAESQDCIAHRSGGGSYWHPDVTKMWRVWQAAYAAGRKAEREEIESKNILLQRFHEPEPYSGIEQEQTGGRAMNVDEAMEAAAEFRADMEARPAWTLFSETVAVVLSAEVERLRAELAEAKAEIQNIVSGQIKANGWEDTE